MKDEDVKKLIERLARIEIAIQSVNPDPALLRPALAFTVVDSVLCLVALAYVPALVKQVCVARLVLVAAILLAVLSLVLYVWLIARAVRQA